MVRSRRRLFFETLEVRSLLSGLSYSLTTDQATYQVGQTIEITFTETNTSDQPLTVEVSPTDFTVWQVPSRSGSRTPATRTSPPPPRPCNRGNR